MEAVEEPVATCGAGDDAVLSALIACEAATRRSPSRPMTLATAKMRMLHRARYSGGERTALADLLPLAGAPRGPAAHRRRGARGRQGRAGRHVLPSRLPVTAGLLDEGRAGLRHVEVVARVLGTRVAAAARAGHLVRGRGAARGAGDGVTPAELPAWGTQLVDALDQDGPEPD